MIIDYYNGKRYSRKYKLIKVLYTIKFHIRFNDLIKNIYTHDNFLIVYITRSNFPLQYLTHTH